MLLSEGSDAAVLRAMLLDPAYRQPSAHTLGMELRAARSRLGDTLSQPSLARTSGGPPPLRTCARCAHMNPPVAQFCMRCGASLTLDATPGAIQDAAVASAQIAAMRRLTPSAAARAAEITGALFAHANSTGAPYP
jgi:hypothetical protein